MAKKKHDKFIEDLLEFIKTRDYVYSKDIPNIDLYMDQVTTFMDDHLGLFKRTEDEKILTKTMINNYSKCDILPPTNRKKYTNEHMILLLFVYYFKNILSIPDIKALLDPVKDIVLRDDSPLSMEDFLDRIMDIQVEHYSSMADQVNHTVSISQDLFTEVNDEDREKLSIFTTAYLLSIQATAQKHMATQLIDNYLSKSNSNAKDKEKPRPKDKSTQAKAAQKAKAKTVAKAKNK